MSDKKKDNNSMRNTVSSYGSLTLKDLERFFAQAEEAVPNNRRMRLIAPNLDIAKEWAEQYPGVDILISSKCLPTTKALKKKPK